MFFDSQCITAAAIICQSIGKLSGCKLSLLCLFCIFVTRIFQFAAVHVHTSFLHQTLTNIYIRADKIK